MSEPLPVWTFPCPACGEPGEVRAESVTPTGTVVFGPAVERCAKCGTLLRGDDDECDPEDDR